MRKILITVLILMLVCNRAFTENPAMEEADGVSSATLAIEKLPVAEAQDNGIIVIFFSPDDTTRAAAYAVAAEMNADLFEIKAQEPYTEGDLDYTRFDSRSMVEQLRETDSRPAIAAMPEDLNRYDTVILGYPIWCGEAPKIMCTFVESANLSGKTVIPFCTSGSSGIGNSARNLKKLTEESVTWLDGGRVVKGYTAEQIGRWTRDKLVPQE